jgi:hypothetical protein
MESTEHRQIGNRVRVREDAGVRLAPEGCPLLTLSAPGVADVSLTYGDIVALGGDLYGTSTLEPISSGTTVDEQVRLFDDAFATLLSGNRAELSKIMQIMDDETQTVLNAPDPVAAFNQLGNTLYLQWNEATGGAPASEGIIGMASNPGRFTSLAKQNLDHFGADAVAAYHAGHLAACRRAGTDLDTALAMNAFADHFLTDLFASGHIRTPRRVLNEYDWILSGAIDRATIGSLLSRAMHDEENSAGLTVTSVARAGATWKAYGDRMALSQQADDNIQEAVSAAQVSCDEVVAAVAAAPDAEPAFAALQHIPRVAGSYPPSGGPSIAPMLVAQGREPLARTAYFPYTRIPKPGLGSTSDYNYTESFVWASVVTETLGPTYIQQLPEGVFLWLSR